MKSIVFQCEFNNVNSTPEGQYKTVPIPDDYFGIQWKVEYGHNYGDLQLFAHAESISNELILHFNYNIQLIGKVTRELRDQCRGNEPFEGVGTYSFMKWEEVQAILVDGGFRVRVDISIIKTVEVNAKPLIEFDKPDERSNLKVVIGDQPFYIERGFLCLHAHYFSPDESELTVTVEDQDPRDAQKCLEMMHLGRVLNESTVEGILHFANFCKAKNIMKMCEVFLLEESKKSLKKKFYMFAKYGLPLDEILNQTKSIAEVKALLPEDLDSLKNEVMDELMKKFASFL